MLGFERKARLFCDEVFPSASSSQLLKIFRKPKLGFERKARLFCDVFFPPCSIITSVLILLGFERKARLFCDLEKNFLV